MTLRYIIRPEHIRGTPITLASRLGVQTRRVPGYSGVPDFRNDFFMIYPASVTNPGEHYGILREFFSRDKAGQRTMIGEAGVKVPRICRRKDQVDAEFAQAGRFVVRPMHHSGSREYRVTSDPRDFTPGSEYISELFPKTREYRILFVYGKPVVFLRKVPEEGVTPEQAWGGQLASFKTINQWEASPLWQTSCFKELAKHAVLKHAHVVAVDVLYAGGQYRVLEYNTCPGLTIERNRDTICDAIRAHHQG